MNHPSARTKYSTGKLTFAAHLLASGKAQLLGTEPVPGSTKVAFVLSPHPATGDIEAFFNGSAIVSALHYSEAINRLKGVAYEGRAGLLRS